MRVPVGDAEEVQKQILEGPGTADLGAEVIEAAVRHHPSVVDDGDIGAELLDDLKDVRGQKDRDARPINSRYSAPVRRSKRAPSSETAPVICLAATASSTTS
jgi:hypothetical protein